MDCPSSHPVRLVPGAEEYVAAGKFPCLTHCWRELRDVQGIIVQRKHVGGRFTIVARLIPMKHGSVFYAVVKEPARKVHMRIGEGKKVVEVLAPLHVDKGQALRRFVQRFGLHGVVFAGDDRTDLDAMQEIELLRKNGIDGMDTIAALAIAVQHADTLSGILEHADIVVRLKGWSRCCAKLLKNCRFQLQNELTCIMRRTMQVSSFCSWNLQKLAGRACGYSGLWCQCFDTVRGAVE